MTGTIEEIHSGDFVQLDERYNDKVVYCVSRMDGDGGKCWIGDKDDRGWYTLTGTLIKVTDPTLISNYFPA